MLFSNGACLLREDFFNDSKLHLSLLYLQVRNMQREVSRDADIVVAAMISIVGSTLIFQGWRLDPLLLLCQVSGSAGLFAISIVVLCAVI